ncbi:response regulator [Neorhodopirellula pilleata]|uniref:Alkaline phosphatase synthesis transcriptional regulatory protein PhoP n=1 Tax=Neorhodopirellula pilleata TaxID=2714738 RepID=A0A5C6AF91_9BACT|nr:response regulator [Neorhodopirellula pilleata]TWT98702.1 Alkaline phosphatase synthesis transcriptional regulatory protein PhoP [Neorhodopirellula pilleata]
MSSTNPPSPNSPVVLIAEDDPVFRRLLQFTIQRCGYNVVVTADGEEAWQRLQGRDIDLLVTDQQMPHCTGIELLLRIANDRAGIAASPDKSTSSRELVRAAILCTAKGLEIDRQRLKDQFGLLDVIGKPFSPKQLARAITDFFSTQSMPVESPTAPANSKIVGASLTANPRAVWNVCPTH